jgi:hypothetical protein
MMSGLAVRQCVVLLKTFRVLCVVGKNKETLVKTPRSLMAYKDGFREAEVAVVGQKSFPIIRESSPRAAELILPALEKIPSLRL